MGRPRKTSDNVSSPRQAAVVPKATSAAPRSSASSTQAKTTATAGRPKSAPAAKSEGDGGKGQAEKPASTRTRAGQGSYQPRSTAGGGSDQGDTKSSSRATSRSSTATGRGKTRTTAGDASADLSPGLRGKPSGHTATSGQNKTINIPLPLTTETVANVEVETRGQRNNPKWHEWRENRITASVAHKIANSKFANDKTSEVPQSYLKAVVNSGSSVQTPAMSWGTKNEKRAVQAYKELKSSAAGKPVKVEDCGLYIHPEKEWLAASPDGIIKEANTGKPLGVLEVKCPYKHREKTVKEACKDKDFCLKTDGDSYSLKKDHAYYTQVQCQLAVTGLNKADFVVHTNKETAIAPVTFDHAFWEGTEPKLEKFYTDAVIPHLEEKNELPVWAKEE